MELEHLKSLWNNAHIPSSSISEEGLQKMLNHRSERPIAVMKRNLKLEVFFLIIIYGAIIGVLSNEGGMEFLLYNALLIIVAILFFIYARYKYKILSSMECTSCDVRSNLNLQLLSLEKLIKLYFRAGNVSVIAAYFFTGTISYIKTTGEPVTLPDPLYVVIFTTIGVILAAGNYFFCRWYLFHLYGKHIQQLKNTLYELDENASA